MQTVHYTKLFLTGALTGLTVSQFFTGSPSTVALVWVGKTGNDTITGNRYRIITVTVTPA